MAKLWGGRFTKKTHPLVEEFSKSIHFDQKLALCDCYGSLIHIDVLKKAKLIDSSEHEKLKKALRNILNSIKKNQFKIDDLFEDIHSYLQHLVESEAGEVALKLHTCRSRNDQIVFDMKLFCTMELGAIMNLLWHLRESLGGLIIKNLEINIPGYTHLQHAIPVKLSEWLGTYSKMLERDRRRIAGVLTQIEVTMGSGALAGTMIRASNYNMALKELLSERSDLSLQLKPSSNPIDTVSDRDFIIETLSALSMIGMHLSRLAEDFILWSTKEFDFIDIDDAFCTGSSLMPQKKNPDVLELIRGYSGRLYGNLLNVLVVMKGLPLSYNRDMQLDKEPLFDSLEIVGKELKVLTELLKNVVFKRANIEKQLQDECLYATDLSDHLVEKGVPFQEAHKIIGELIQYKLSTGKEIKQMAKDELKEFHPELTPAAVQRIIDPKASVDSKKSILRTNK